MEKRDGPESLEGGVKVACFSSISFSFQCAALASGAGFDSLVRKRLLWRRKSKARKDKKQKEKNQRQARRNIICLAKAKKF